MNQEIDDALKTALDETQILVVSPTAVESGCINPCMSMNETEILLCDDESSLKSCGQIKLEVDRKLSSIELFNNPISFNYSYDESLLKENKALEQGQSHPDLKNDKIQDFFSQNYNSFEVVSYDPLKSEDIQSSSKAIDENKSDVLFLDTLENQNNSSIIFMTIPSQSDCNIDSQTIDADSSVFTLDEQNCVAFNTIFIQNPEVSHDENIPQTFEASLESGIQNAKEIAISNLTTIEERIAARNLLLPRPISRKRLTTNSYVECGVCNMKMNRETKKHSSICNTKLNRETKKLCHVCGMCGFKLDSNKEIIEHEAKCSSENHPFKCNYCEDTFTKILFLSDHVRVIHCVTCPHECRICSRMFQRSHDLKIHLNLHLGIKKNVCDVCGKLFNHSSNLIRHQRIHTGVKPYLCPICGVRFAQLSAMHNHKEIRHNNKSKTCLQCPSIFKTSFSLKNHVKNMHNGGASNAPKIFKPRCYYCRVCGDKFRLKSHLIAHETSHHGGSEFNCLSCSRTFQTIDEIKTHSCSASSNKKLLPVLNLPSRNELSENDENKLPAKDDMLVIYLNPGEENSTFFVQEVEDKNSHSKDVIMINVDGNLDLDSMSFEKDVSEVKQIVEENKNTNFVQTYIDDISEVLPADDFLVSPTDSSNDQLNVTKEKDDTAPKVDSSPPKKSFICKECGKEFRKKWNLQQHEATHDSSLHRYFCKHCGRSFAYRSTLTKHEARHKPSWHEPVHSCPLCDKSYASISSLQSHHKRDHLKQRRFSCDICEKKFFYKSDYDYHKRIHANDNCYICFACGKKFSHLSHLHRHERLHTGERPYKCSHCPKGFIQAVSLQEHLKKHDKEEEDATTKPQLDLDVPCEKIVVNVKEDHSLDIFMK